jgi:Flp pilus assembly protein TadD
VVGPPHWKRCLGFKGPIIDTVIAGCTAIIQSGQEPCEKLATAFDNRGVAYRQKGEDDRALQDYEQAIQLNPSNATAYNAAAKYQQLNGLAGLHRDAVPSVRRADSTARAW